MAPDAEISFGGCGQERLCFPCVHVMAARASDHSIRDGFNDALAHWVRGGVFMLMAFGAELHVGLVQVAGDFTAVRGMAL